MQPQNAPGPGTGMPFGQPQPYAYPMYPPSPRAGLLVTSPVYATPGPGSSFAPPTTFPMSNPTLGHGWTTATRVQHPMGPPFGMQPGSGTVIRQPMHEFIQDMRSLYDPPGIPQRIGPPPGMGPMMPGLVPPPGTPGYGPGDPNDIRYGLDILSEVTVTPVPRSSDPWGSGVAGPSSSAIPAPTPTPNLSTPQPPGPNPNPPRRTNAMAWDITELQLMSEAWAAGARRNRGPDDTNGS
ncbi:hypothetical protein GSI_07565 [Ganoderma sinense ZZ0214-1]|uniref:Uncharacterized protein n=1 Tax=Ganoderma sinense ZZ0214-1 TaxID=1077348 RepID=A0A2G8S9E4_9APHY|nr:hypothetical protein GSI_07565 [Ganoderma sinense ZZ0214-1]